MQPLSVDDPQVIGAYRLLGRLGAGGMGRVYLGRSAGGRTVAVKVVHPHFALDEEFRARFRREVESARRVGVALAGATAPVLDADPDAAVPWVATGYVAGPSLTQAVAEAGPLPPGTVRALGAGLAQALAAVHGLGLVHRDVKPSNVLLALDGPRLIDFGIARAVHGTVSLTSTGVSVGSPGYMAPEQILGQGVTGAADVFSLGAVLTYAATGEPPFPGDSSAALLYKVVHESPVLGPALTGGLRELVTACLAKAPQDRPAPQEIARLLAGPEGAGALPRPGWLPGPLVERVSRQAVELLDLEGSAPDPGPQSPNGLHSQPVPGSNSQPVPGNNQPVRRMRTWGHLPAVAGGGERAGQGQDPAQAPTETAHGAAAMRKRRRLSCTLVLTVAGALAATTTALFVLDVLPGGSHDAGKASHPPAGSSGPASARAVPKEFLGTWTGSVIQSDGTPNGTMTSTVTAGGRGAYVVRTNYSALGLLECRSKAKLISATSTRITLEEVTDGEKSALCTGETATVTYTLAAGGRLAFTSDDPRGGRPTATLTRSGG
ncbi:serine/threonine-protein kinase [Streptomyces sp. NPDC026206]|uniref:serine/threonine-protein kinase n=1 Tax=Streptomyces sp. NPDC026206 TaxID=3157089 RepID=UPI0033D0AEBE